MECNQNLRIQKVMCGVVAYSEVTAVEILADGTAIFDYSNTSTEGGDIDTIQYECLDCGAEIKVEDIPRLLNGEDEGEQQRRDEKNGVYPGKEDVCN